MRKKCNHAHTDRCSQCEALDELLDSIEKVVQGASFSLPEERDEALYIFQHVRQAIILWKCHQIRTVRQDQARLEVLDRLDDKTCLITNDWAMKFLPQHFRETQSDWFAKRGMSWHIVLWYAESVRNFKPKPLFKFYSRVTRVVSPSFFSWNMCYIR